MHTSTSHMNCGSHYEFNQQDSQLCERGKYAFMILREYSIITPLYLCSQWVLQPPPLFSIINICLYSVRNVCSEWRNINTSNGLLSVGSSIMLWLIDLINVIYCFDLPSIWMMIINSPSSNIMDDLTFNTTNDLGLMDNYCKYTLIRFYRRS